MTWKTRFTRKIISLHGVSWLLILVLEDQLTLLAYSCMTSLHTLHSYIILYKQSQHVHMWAFYLILPISISIMITFPQRAILTDADLTSGLSTVLEVDCGELYSKTTAQNGEPGVWMSMASCSTNFLLSE